MKRFDVHAQYKMVRGGRVLFVTDGKSVTILANEKNKRKMQEIFWDMYRDTSWFKVVDNIFSYEFAPENVNDEVSRQIVEDMNEKYKIKTTLIDMREFESPFKKILGEVTPMILDRSSYVGSMFYGYCERSGLNPQDVIERVMQNFVTKHFPVAMIRDPFTDKERIRQ